MGTQWNRFSRRILSLVLSFLIAFSTVDTGMLHAYAAGQPDSAAEQQMDDNEGEKDPQETDITDGDASSQNGELSADSNESADLDTNDDSPSVDASGTEDIDADYSQDQDGINENEDDGTNENEDDGITEDQNVTSGDQTPEDDSSDGSDSFDGSFADNDEGTLEVNYPAFSQEKEIDGVTIKVAAEEGTFPEGASLEVSKVSKKEEKEVAEAVEEVRDTERNIASSYTVDISIVDKDGNDLQPANEHHVDVSFKADEVKEELLTTEVFHITEDKTTGEKEAEALVVEENQKKGVATAETDGFSTYVLKFTYEGIPYEMNNSTIDVGTIMHEVGLTGKVYSVVIDGNSTHSRSSENSLLKVEYTGSDPAASSVAIGSGSSATKASDWTVTAKEGASGTCRVLITLFERPTYIIDVITDDSITPEHKIILRHLDGKEVTTDNPLRQSEIVEVYVTGYSDSERAGLTYSYILDNAKNGNSYTTIFWTAVNNLDTSGVMLNTTNGTQTIGATEGQWLNKEGCRYFVIAYRNLVNTNNNTNAKVTKIDLKITVSGAADDFNKTGMSVEPINLEKDMKDVARTVHPIILYEEDSNTKANIKDILGDAGIAHFKKCNYVDVTVSDNSNPQITQSVDATTPEIITGKQYGYSDVDVTCTKSLKNGNTCAYHGVTDPTTVNLPVFVLKQATGAIEGNVLTISKINPWCHYQVYDITDSDHPEQVGSDLYPTLKDADANDKDKQLTDDDEVFTIPNLTFGHKYKVVEILDINFAAIDNETKVIFGNPGDANEVITPNHDHDWSYTLSGNSFTATCGNEDCTVANGTIAMALNAEDSYVFGSSIAASLDNDSDFATATGATVGTIKYYNSNDQEVSSFDTIGTYTAKVTVTAGGEDYILTKQFEVAKAKAATPDALAKPSLEADGYDTIKITNPVSGLKYTLLDSNGTPIKDSNDDPIIITAGSEEELTFSGLDPNTEYKVAVCTPGDSEHDDSDPLISDRVRTGKQPEDTPEAPTVSALGADGASISSPVNGTKYTFTSGEETITVTIDSEGNITTDPATVTAAIDENGNLNVSGLSPDKVYDVTAVTLATGDDMADSDPSTATSIKTAKAAPTTPAQNDLVGEAGNDGSITRVDSSMEYSTDGGTTWTAIAEGATEITGLSQGTVLIRYKEVGESGDTPAQAASEVTSVTVNQKPMGQNIEQGTDISATATTDSITVTAPLTDTDVNPEVIYEYRIGDNGDWQTETTFNGLAAGTTYKVYARMQETSASMPSDAIQLDVVTKAEAPNIFPTATSLTLNYSPHSDICG